MQSGAQTDKRPRAGPGAILQDTSMKQRIYPAIGDLVALHQSQIRQGVCNAQQAHGLVVAQEFDGSFNDIESMLQVLKVVRKQASGEWHIVGDGIPVLTPLDQVQHIIGPMDQPVDGHDWSSWSEWVSDKGISLVLRSHHNKKGTVVQKIGKVLPLQQHSVVTVELPDWPLRGTPKLPAGQNGLQFRPPAIPDVNATQLPSGYEESLLLIQWIAKYPTAKHADSEELWKDTRAVVRLGMEHLRCLGQSGQDGWLNDSVIGNVASILSNPRITPTPIAPEMALISSHYTSKIAQDKYAHLSTAPWYKEAKRNTMCQCMLFGLPMHAPFHWFFVLYMRDQKTFLIFDSIPRMRSEAYKPEIKRAQRFLEEHLSITFPETTQAIVVPVSVACMGGGGGGWQP